MIPQQLIDNVLEDWAVDFVQGRIADARRAKLVASSKFVNSFDAEVKAAIGEVRSVFIAFDSSGRYLDLRRQKKGRGGKEYIEELKGWIEEIGVQKLKSKFEKKYRLPKNREQLLNRMAWGIIKSKKKRKRRKWYASKREDDIQKLYVELLDAYSLTTLKAIKNGN